VIVEIREGEIDLRTFSYEFLGSSVGERHHAIAFATVNARAARAITAAKSTEIAPMAAKM
jgi:hypothetical protein